jgi:hypothetical protein
MGSDGAQPAVSLIFYKQGNLYGTTATGGEGGSCPSNDPHCSTACFDHNDMGRNVLDVAHITWGYYARDEKSLWTAPNSIKEICGASGGACVSRNDDAAPILTDIENCSLPQVSWVTPDGDWSDHPPGSSTPDENGGPSWLAWIVNAVGNSTCASPAVNWSNTVILVVWDDWGGFYDDVDPERIDGGPGIGYPNQTGQQYVYGFRVPLLVVSAYTKQVTPQGGYISGPLSKPQCQGNNYCHDFGSILNFIEYAFGQKGQRLADIYPQYRYADFLAPDYNPNDSTSFSLSDFFTPNFSQSHAFQKITGWKYPEVCFHEPENQGCFPNYPQDPDSDAIDDQTN